MLRRIRIRNFRSISDTEIDTDNMNILVGRNDCGKSNILRAINLFFNDQTDFRQNFNFSRDFSNHAITGQGKASEIVIEAFFDLPEGYSAPKGTKSIQVTRKWRASGRTSETIRFVLSGNRKNDVGNRSKINSYIQNMGFRYIPALKGREFFSDLMADVYDVVSEVSEKELLRAAEPLQDQVESILDSVSKELEQSLSAASAPKLPSNLRSIFRLIQFEADGIDLDRRGDGIRVRHVPSLIKFLCDMNTERSGRYKSFHIWGFEEPENSVDFLSAFDLRDELKLIAESPQYQMLITTHSPIFFNLNESADVNTIYCSKSQHVTTIDKEDPDIAEQMGVLKFVSPYVEESKKRAEDLHSSVKLLTEKLDTQIIDPTRKTVFCEGETDVLIMNCLSEYYVFLKEWRFVDSFGEGESSANQVADNLVGWHYFQKGRNANERVICIGLFDNDDAAKKAKDKFNANISEQNNPYSKILFYRPSEKLISDAKHFGLSPNPIMEMLASDSIWEIAKNLGCLKKKSQTSILSQLSKSNREKLITKGTNHLYDSSDVRILKFIYEVKPGNKIKFANMMVESIVEDPAKADSFKRTLDEMHSIFGGALV